MQRLLKDELAKSERLATPSRRRTYLKEEELARENSEEAQPQGQILGTHKNMYVYRCNTFKENQHKSNKAKPTEELTEVGVGAVAKHNTRNRSFNQHSQY